MIEPDKIPAVGDIAPDFALRDALGVTRRLSTMANDRPWVLVFYRGHW